MDFLQQLFSAFFSFCNALSGAAALAPIIPMKNAESKNPSHLAARTD